MGLQLRRGRTLVKRCMLGLIFVASLAGCSGQQPALNDAATANDPFESHNRHTFALNQAIDTYALKPLSQGYNAVTPSVFRLIVKNELDYISTPKNLFNSILQGDLDRVGHVLGRFALNTTIGGLGLLDPASDLGLKPVSEDFGQTLAVYGVGEGFYWMAPLLGPSSPRDLAGKVVDALTNPLGYIGGGNAGTFTGLGQKGMDILEYRAQALESLDALERGSTDFYASIRSAYRQKRNIEILNDDSGVSAFQDIE